MKRSLAFKAKDLIKHYEQHKFMTGRAMYYISHSGLVKFSVGGVHS